MSNFAIDNSSLASTLIPQSNPALSNHQPDSIAVSVFEKNLGTAPSGITEIFKDLTSGQQAQIRNGLDKLDKTSEAASLALQDAIAAKPDDLDLTRISDLEYVSSWMSQSEVFMAKSGVALQKADEAVQSGLTLMKTLQGIDSELPKTLPDVGTNLVNLMSLLPSTYTQIDINAVKLSFGIS